MWKVLRERDRKSHLLAVKRSGDKVTEREDSSAALKPPPIDDFMMKNSLVLRENSHERILHLEVAYLFSLTADNRPEREKERERLSAVEEKIFLKGNYSKVNIHHSRCH